EKARQAAEANAASVSATLAKSEQARKTAETQAADAVRARQAAEAKVADAEKARQAAMAKASDVDGGRQAVEFKPNESERTRPAAQTNVLVERIAQLPFESAANRQADYAGLYYTDCDRFAASPADTQRSRSVPGVNLARIDVTSALAA